MEIERVLPTILVAGLQSLSQVTGDLTGRRNAEAAAADSSRQVGTGRPVPVAWNARPCRHLDTKAPTTTMTKVKR